MSNRPNQHLYHLQNRGDRTAPNRGERTYHSLKLLLRQLNRIVQSDQLTAGEAILDYGCADSPYRFLFEKKFRRYIGADLPGNEHADLTINEKGQLPVESESFDCVLSSQVLEHVLNPKQYLNEAWRILKPQGSLILSTHGIWSYHPDPNDYWRWTVEGLKSEIQQAGFEVSQMYSVFGPESSALQLWQDATSERLPAFARTTYIRIIQMMIGFIEGRHENKFSNDASIYVLLGHKTLAPEN